MFSTQEVRDLALAMTRQLVENPDAVQADFSTTGSATVMLMKVAKEDLGRVIGKNGRTIDAIRVLLSTIAAKSRHQIVFDVREAVRTERSANHSRSSPLQPVHAQTGS